MGPALALAVFIIAGFIVYISWDHLAALVPPDDESVAQNERDNNEVKDPPAKPSKSRVSSGKAPVKKDSSGKDTPKRAAGGSQQLA